MTNDYSVYKGHHGPIISKEMWMAAQRKRKANGGRSEPIEKE